MASQDNVPTISLEASADLSAHQFKFMAVDSSSQLALQTSSTAANAGVLLDKPDAQGKVGTLAIGGMTKVEAGATVTAGAQGMADGTGRVIDHTGVNMSAGVIIDGGAVGEVVRVLLQPIGIT